MRHIILLFLSFSLAKAKPNIIFVIADDLGYGDLGCYGQKTTKTPVLDRLAAGGIRFTRHYSGSSVCSPSRSSLMTGLDTGTTWLRDNGEFELRPDPDDLTVATLLKKAGYKTAMIGKSCVSGNTQNPQRVLDKGFDLFYGTTSHKDAHYRYPAFVYDQTKRVDLPENKLHNGKLYDAEIYTARAEKFIEEVDQPFFLLLSYPIPHASLLVPGDAIQKGTTKKNGHYSYVRDPRANYRAMVEALDTYVGRVVKALEDKGVAKDTLILFTSDNGSHREGGYSYEMLNSCGGLRGGKRDLYEGGIRVPMIAHWPSGIKKTGDSDHVSAFWDFLPTVCELANIKIPERIHGISYAPLLTGKTVQLKHEFLYWEFHELGTRRALLKNDWKLVQYNLAKGGKPELYDLNQDPGELNNLSSQRPDQVNDMVEIMKKRHLPSPIFPNKELDR